MPRRLALAALTALAAGPAGAQPPPNASFYLVNRSPVAINEVYATPKGRRTWGQDRLGRHFLPQGQSFPVRLPADGTCAYDIRVVYADGKAEERRGFDPCAVDSVAFPLQPRSP